MVLTGYDALALRYARKALPFRITVFASFISYVFSNNMGFSAVTGGLVRYRIYSSFGVSAFDIAKISIFCAVTFWIGLLLLGGTVFVIDPLPLPSMMHAYFKTTLPIGTLFLVGAVGYLVACGSIRKSLVWREWRFSFPSLGYGAAQLILGAADWMAASAVLFVLLPKGIISFPHLVGIFILAQGVGLVSNVPGGLGVFETTAMLMLKSSLPAPTILSVLLFFRVLYYLVPLMFALFLFTGHELYRRKAAVKQGVTQVARWTGPLAPWTYSLCAFMAGVILLISGATPGVYSRLQWLDRIFPLTLLELSHFLGSLAGAALLLLARGLQQRLDGAWMLSACILSLGIALSLIKGGDYEEALILGCMLVALLPSRPYFYRKTPLSSQTFSWSWSVAIFIVLASTTWLGFFSYKHLAYSNEMWWHFSVYGNASRFMRANVGAACLVLLISLRLLVRPAHSTQALPLLAEIDEAYEISKNQAKTNAYLSTLGDKHLLFSAGRAAFIMYGIQGRTWVSMGDPVGDKKEWVELAWAFKEECDDSAAWPVFYQVGPENIPLYLDLGLSLLKLGEDARVPLVGFTLEGKTRKGLRYAYNKAIKDGCSFEVIPVAQVGPLLPALKAVSDEWLANKRTREKGFSLGRFDEAYLLRYPMAVVRKEGVLVAFANVWEGGDKEEISIDLMRHTSAAPELIMEYLLVNLFFKGAEEGYRYFSLGMAPLAGFEKRNLNPTWHKVAGILFRHGEHFYNFKGLRSFKEKFHPEWQPRYLAAPGGFAMPRILANLTSLISGGIKGVVSK